MIPLMEESAVETIELLEKVASTNEDFNIHPYFHEGTFYLSLSFGRLVNQAEVIPILDHLVLNFLEIHFDQSSKKERKTNRLGFSYFSNL